jgi:hypothetical protein
MRPTNFNAFLPEATSGRCSRRRSLASLLAPMRAILEPRERGFVLEVEPICPVDAFVTWRQHRTADGLEALVSFRDDAEATPAETIAALGIPTIERFADGRVVLAPDPLSDLLATSPRAVEAVVIDGPIDERDAVAIAAAAEAGSALAGDLRAVLALRAAGPRGLHVELRSVGEAAEIVSSNFPHYLAALTGRSYAAFTTPEPAIIERLFARTGRISVRPIETEMYSTAVDVGVSTHREGEPGPADASLIYDLYSHTWHGD